MNNYFVTALLIIASILSSSCSDDKITFHQQYQHKSIGFYKSSLVHTRLAKQQLQDGDFDQAKSNFIQASAQENPEALYYLAMIYEEGIGVTPDYDKSFKYFQKSAQMGFAPSQFVLGAFYETGIGVDTSASEACNWYLKAAKRGYPNAEREVADCFASAKWGNTADLKSARNWYQKAASQQEQVSQIKLAIYLLNGWGGKVDYQQARYWLNKNNEDDRVQYYLGIMYTYGLGVQIDLVLAYNYYLLSAEQGNQAAMVQIGLANLYGKGVPVNLVEARKWLERALDFGNSQASYYLAFYYLKLNNYEKAAEYFKLSGSAGKVQLLLLKAQTGQGSNNYVNHQQIIEILKLILSVNTNK